MDYKLFVSAIVISTSAHASQVDSMFIEGRSLNALQISQYWTPERLKNAREMPLPRAVAKANESNLSKPVSLRPKTGEDGTPPEIDTIDPDIEPLFISDNLQFLQSDEQDNNGFNKGTSGYHFTSSRLVPATADLAYPYRAVGKLFFTIPNQGDYVCSAAVIKSRIILTAGHCVHEGANGANGYYTNFQFIPAYRDGVAPYKSWSGAYVQTTSAWAAGGGNVPNTADYAMIELNDTVVNAVSQKIGVVTGTLGYQLKSLLPNHAHLLGYPCNFDGCAKMHQVTAQSAKQVAPNNVEYGSDMQGGSSGGPWVQNFGEPSPEQTAGQNAGLNRIIGVTSYGYNATDVMLQGSSILDTPFTTLLNAMCAHKTGNCA